ncbi:MAG: nickel-dependent lactate racemase [Planctomycetaceae bacterium]|nr:nickel-dependent lactate racemase [Planctomycetaceae bacterium]
MRVQLDYGRTGLWVELPSSQARLLAYQQMEPLPDAELALDQLLDTPTGTPALDQLATHCKTACIAICDITRPVPNQLILSALLRRLERSGIQRENILILVATGLHRPNNRDELIEMVGEDIVNRYRIENHDGQNRDQHRYLGQSPRDVPIWIDSRYLDADFKITTGLIEPHLMAGFSGGRKVICPGLAGIDTVRVWHGPNILDHPRADCGNLDGNPVHEENTWIARRAGCDFIVNAVIDAERRPLKLVAGDMEQAFAEGVSFVRDVVSATVPEPVDIVVTSSAGYPLDTTFYQSVKGLTAALPIIKEGGTIILAASMTEGIGSQEFAQLFQKHPTVEDFLQQLFEPDYFSLDQWQLQKLAQVLAKARVEIVTDGLSSDTINSLFVRSVPSVEEAINLAFDRYGPQASLAVIPKGPYVLTSVA